MPHSNPLPPSLVPNFQTSSQGAPLTYPVSRHWPSSKPTSTPPIQWAPNSCGLANTSEPSAPPSLASSLPAQAFKAGGPPGPPVWAEGTSWSAAGLRADRHTHTKRWLPPRAPPHPHLSFPSGPAPPRSGGPGPFPRTMGCSTSPKTRPGQGQPWGLCMGVGGSLQGLAEVGEPEAGPPPTSSRQFSLRVAPEGAKLCGGTGGHGQALTPKDRHPPTSMSHSKNRDMSPAPGLLTQDPKCFRRARDLGCGCELTHSMRPVSAAPG